MVPPYHRNKPRFVGRRRRTTSANDRPGGQIAPDPNLQGKAQRTFEAAEISLAVPVPEARHARERSASEHVRGQVSGVAGRAADQAVRHPDQHAHQRLGHFLLGDRGEADAAGIRQRNYEHAQGARKECE
uniref:(northern house mosquito) hypothetical protein n=1 Tax=Culex pipiens TaxID=7175 RepID=A0A8D8BXH3_CULPI